MACWNLFPEREDFDTTFYVILTQIWWFVRRSCIRQQSIQFLPLQGAVKGLLFAEGGEGPLRPGLGFWSFKHFSVWNRVHARNMQIATVISSLAPIRRDKGRHPASIWVAKRFTFLGAVGEEIHTCEQKTEATDGGFSNTTICLWMCSAAQLCPTPCDPVNCSPPGSSVHEILQARILEWAAIPSSRASAQLRSEKLQAM